MWAEALQPVLETCALAGLEVPAHTADAIGGRFAEYHAAEFYAAADHANGLWCAADLTEEILNGLRKE